MSAFGKRLQQKKFSHRDVPICLNPDTLKVRDEAEHAVRQALLGQSRVKDDRLGAGEPAEVAAARKRLAEAEEAVRAESVILRFTAVPYAEYNQFMVDNPPREGKNESFNPKTFFMYVARKTGQYVDESGKVHDISAAEWDEFEKSLTDGEHDRIANAVIELNRTEGARRLDFLSSASAATTDSSGTSA